MWARMEYCGPRGIPLSRFLAWKPEDQDAALQWQARRSQTCSGCGTHPDEWNPKAGGHRQAYVPVLEMCPGCYARDGKADTDEAKGAGPGLRVTLRPNPNL